MSLDKIKKLDRLEDPAFTRRITRYRQNIVGLLKPEYIKAEIEKMIEECKFLDYYNERAKNFHDNFSFKLRVKYFPDIFNQENFPNKEIADFLTAKKTIIDSVDSNGNFTDPMMKKFIEYQKNIVNQAIIIPFTDLIYKKSELLIDRNDLLKLERDSIFNDYPELNKHIKQYITTTLFRLVVNVKENAIFLEFLY